MKVTAQMSSLLEDLGHWRKSCYFCSHNPQQAQFWHGLLPINPSEQSLFCSHVCEYERKSWQALHIQAAKPPAGSRCRVLRKNGKESPARLAWFNQKYLFPVENGWPDWSLLENGKHAWSKLPSACQKLILIAFVSETFRINNTKQLETTWQCNSNRWPVYSIVLHRQI